MEIVSESNFLLFAAQHYNNPQCGDTIEFYDDLKRFKYIKRLFYIYKDTGELRERLILNHIIILYNLFGTSATQMLFVKLFDYREQLKPFLELLNFLPEKIIGIGNSSIVINSKDIDSDSVIKTRLSLI